MSDPGIQTAKQIAEKALMMIGAFPPSRSASNPAELKRALMWLEMVLNNQSGVATMAGFWRFYEIDLEAGIGDYLLSDYDVEGGTQEVFSAVIVETNGTVEPLSVFLWENEIVLQNLSDTGRPSCVVFTKDAAPEMRVYPMPTQVEQDAGLKIRIRAQVMHSKIDLSPSMATALLLRPTWYLWLTKRLAYEIGSGPVRALGEGELKRYKDDAEELESMLLGHDGKYNSRLPPVTEPMKGA